MTKKYLYITLFTLLGILVSFLVHAFVEIPIINLLLKDFETYGLGLTWDDWFMIHSIGSMVTLIVGATFGCWGGIHWWKVIYVEKRYPHKIGL